LNIRVGHFTLGPTDIPANELII